MIGLKNLKIGIKLLYGFGVVLILMLIISSVTLWKLQVVDGFVDDADVRTEDSLVLGETLGLAHQIYTVLADTWINQDLVANKAEFEELQRTIAKDFEAVGKIVDTEEERRLLAKAETLAQKMMDIYPRWVELVVSGDGNAIQELDEKIDAWRGDYSEAMQMIAGDLAEERAEATHILQATVRNVFMIVLILTIVAVVTGIGMALLIGRAVVTPIRQTAAMLKEIASGDGDLTGRLDASSRDEIGDLARNFNQFIEKLQNTIAQVTTNAGTLTTSAMELSSVSTQTAQSVRTLSERTSLIAAAAEETSANTDSVAGGMDQATNSLSSVAGATEEMSATVSEIAGNTEKARRISEQAMQQAQGVTATMQSLGTAAREIDRVTETITEISSQTNLLALNATIEAARAGEAGKGFAVVAGEIKALARQTADATEDIKRRISGIQASTGSAVSDINQINQVIREVGELVNSIAAAIEEQSVVTRDLAGNIAQVSAGVQDANERVAQTAEVSREMARDIAEVNTAATNIRSGGEQVQASAAELTSLAEQLKSLVGQFKVGIISQSATDSQSKELIRWDDSLSVGVTKMDDHHKELIRIINALHAALKEKRGLDVTRKLLRDLTSYVDFHFRAEEEFLAGIKYPELEDQKISHRKFEDKLASMQQRWNAGDTSVTSEMMRMLQDWLIAHIKVMDMKYGNMVRKSK